MASLWAAVLKKRICPFSCVYGAYSGSCSRVDAYADEDGFVNHLDMRHGPYKGMTGTEYTKKLVTADKDLRYSSLVRKAGKPNEQPAVLAAAESMQAAIDASSGLPLRQAANGAAARPPLAAVAAPPPPPPPPSPPVPPLLQAVVAQPAPAVPVLHVQPAAPDPVAPPQPRLPPPAPPPRSSAEERQLPPAPAAAVPEAQEHEARAPPPPPPPQPPHPAPVRGARGPARGAVYQKSVKVCDEEALCWFDFIASEVEGRSMIMCNVCGTLFNCEANARRHLLGKSGVAMDMVNAFLNRLTEEPKDAGLKLFVQKATEDQGRGTFSSFFIYIF